MEIKIQIKSILGNVLFELSKENNTLKATLYGANHNEGTAFFAPQCPDGSFIGYKKVVDNKIVKLFIPEDAKRSSSTSLKCRCSKAFVLDIQELNGQSANIKSISSNHDHNFIYTVDEIVEVPNFDEDRWNECSSGIHFFISRDVAVQY